jgi:FkbM family methyltransferase
MNPSFKSLLTSARRLARRSALVRLAHAHLVSFRDGEHAKRLFKNHDAYFRALHEKSDGNSVLEMRDGLKVRIRHNVLDARIVREIFLDQPYVAHVDLPADPVVVDVGGYIGDFSLYAVKRLGATRVIVFEPARENFAVLEKNVALNRYEGRITAVNKAVASSSEITLNVESLAHSELHVSAYWYQQAEQRKLPALTLPQILSNYGLATIDLLKVDCEGGEYDMFTGVPSDVFRRIQNIVFEWHAIPGYEPRLTALLDLLRNEGYDLRIDGDIVSATRPRVEIARAAA